MKIPGPRIAVPCLFLSVAAFAARPAEAADDSSVRAAIEAEEARFAQAEIRRDAEAMAGMYLDSAAGRESAARRLERLGGSGGTLVDERFEISNLEVCDDIAVESGQTVSQWDFPGRPRSVDRLRYLSVWKRAPGGEWKVARDLWIAAGSSAPSALSPPVPAPGAASPAASDTVPLPDPRSLSDGFTRTIQDDLKASARRLRSLSGGDPKKRRSAAAKADRDLQKVIRDVGWIDVDRFGVASACNAAYIVSQSGDAALMRATLPLMEKDLNHDGNDPACYRAAREAFEALSRR